MKLEKLIGIPVFEAEKILKQSGKILRIIKNDDENFCVTCEYRENRVNVEVEQGTITNVLCQG